MGEKQVIVTLEDGFGRVQTSIATSLSAPQLMDKIMEIDEQQATIDMQELRLQQLEEILELSENLNKSYREKLIEKIKEIDKLTEENEQLRKQVAEYEMILRQHEFAEQEGFR